MVALRWFLQLLHLGQQPFSPPTIIHFCWTLSREVQTLKIEFNASERHNTLVWQSHRIWGLWRSRSTTTTDPLWLWVCSNSHVPLILHVVKKVQPDGPMCSFFWGLARPQEFVCVICNVSTDLCSEKTWVQSIWPTVKPPDHFRISTSSSSSSSSPTPTTAATMSCGSSASAAGCLHNSHCCCDHMWKRSSELGVQWWVRERTLFLEFVETYSRYWVFFPDWCLHSSMEGD